VTVDEIHVVLGVFMCKLGSAPILNAMRITIPRWTS